METGSGGGGGGGRLPKTESAEMRWVVPGGTFEEDEIESSDDGGADTPAAASGSRGGGCSDDDNYEEDEMLRQRLVRTGPRADSFDVEALDVPGVYRHQEFTLGRSIVLTLQTLGVVFGDVGTSPLYTFDIMFNKYPITSKEDVLGALSLVIYTLILIPFLKYTLIVLWGNDDGEGGTFALYSLICRNAKASLLPNQLPSDTRISSFHLKVPSVELERSLKIKERLETSSMLKKLLLMLVLFGTSMVIADGVVTPAMSVMSAVNGLKVGISSVNEGEVVMITVAFLIVLFSLQRFGTSKVGLAVGPALFIWFCCLAGIGIYNIRTYGSEVLHAFNPVYIYYYFERNPTQAWISLGGCLLCATGSEAMFADLCYFSVRSVQFTFVFLVLPCLLLGYLGQAAFLMENLTANQQVFFLSIPRHAFWPVVFIATLAALIASRAMTTAIFSTIKQATALGCFPRLKIIHTSRKFMGQIYIPVMNWFLLASCLAFVTAFGSINEIGNAYGIAELGVMMMTTVLVTIIMLLIWQVNIVVVLCFLTLFLGLELFFFSSVLGSAADGSWVLLVFAAVLYLVMYIWNYGTKLKYETEVKQKLSMDLLMQLGCNLGTVRAPGIGLLYNELVRGVPAIFGQFLTTLPAIHSMIIFVCIKWVPVPVVPQNERFLFRRVCPKSYHMFRCIARYGYKDVRKENPQAFEQLLIESLEKFIRREAQERSLESDRNDDTDSEEEVASASSRVLVGPNGSIYSLGVPLAESAGADNSTLGSSMSFDGSLDEAMDGRRRLDNELSFIHKAKESGVVYLLGHGDIRAWKESFFVKKLVINYFYAFLRKNCRRGIATLSIPHTRLMQVAMQYMV
ncbi:probable potassium transporter 14 isoform X1 [Phragmites australis]|uniref:probable potassium transporter 14 isoform X1 n=1 Tax=Phragmites australis TaxID=29695 RepID=UPI002D78DF43|nr:probable potassium transporter 14 isoform X1 [Phragmites australis]